MSFSNVWRRSAGAEVWNGLSHDSLTPRRAGSYTLPSAIALRRPSVGENPHGPQGLRLQYRRAQRACHPADQIAVHEAGGGRGGRAPLPRPRPRDIPRDGRAGRVHHRRRDRRGGTGPDVRRARRPASLAPRPRRQAHDHVSLGDSTHSADAHYVDPGGRADAAPFRVVLRLR